MSSVEKRSRTSPAGRVLRQSLALPTQQLWLKMRLKLLATEASKSPTLLKVLCRGCQSLGRRCQVVTIEHKHSLDKTSDMGTRKDSSLIVASLTSNTNSSSRKPTLMYTSRISLRRSCIWKGAAGHSQSAIWRPQIPSSHCHPSSPYLIHPFKATNCSSATITRQHKPDTWPRARVARRCSLECKRRAE